MIRFMRSSTYRAMTSATAQMQDDLLTKSLENTRYASALTAFQRQIHESDQRLASLLNEIGGRDEIIRDQETKLEEQGILLTQAEKRIDERDDRIRELDRRISEFDRYIRDHETRRANVETRRGFFGKLLGRFG